MLRGVIYGIFGTLLVAAVAVYLVLEIGLIRANADAEPGPVETWAARTSLHATLRREAPDRPNPITLTDQHLVDGIQLYAHNCAVCHGSARGAESASPIAKGLYQKPPQLASEGVEDDPESVSFWKIKHGIRLTGMPSFAATLSDQEIWTLALFLAHMDKLPPSVKPVWDQVQNWPIAVHP
jgi:mono/diheme cytochrome c family protein